MLLDFVNVKCQSLSHNLTVLTDFFSPTEYPKKGRCSIEIIKELDNMVEDLLRVFAGTCNGHLPNKIVFYRDGVDEGHFAKVLANEVNKIKEACRSKILSCR
jgi:eukaryotic translation initiation factor 2C